MIRVGDITDDTYHILKNFERTSKNALRTMKIAYGYLKENLEGEAFKIFTQIGEKSEEMCRISDDLSKKCMEESTKVNALGNETLKEKVATEANNDKAGKLVKQSREEKIYQEQIRDESVKNVDEKEKESKGTLIDVKKLIQDKKELSRKTQNMLQHERQSVKKQKAELKLSYENDDREILKEVKKCQQKFESALLSNKESYEQELYEIESTYKQKIKSVEDDYKIKIKQNEKELQQSKSESKKLFDERVKENKENYDKKASDAKTEYKFTIKNIDKEYQSAIQASNDKLENMLELAAQQLEAALEANEKIYSAKVKACIDERVAEVNEEWSKRDAEEKRIKCENENMAKSDNIRAHKIAQENRDSKLNRTFEDKQSKIVKAETDILSNKMSDEQTLTDFDKFFEEKIKSDEDAEIKKIQEDLKKIKKEKEKHYEQSNKEIKEVYDRIVSDAGNVYKLAEKLIEKEYKDGILTSNDELNNKLIIAQKKLDAALEANNQLYGARVNNSWFWKSSIRDEWYRKNTEEQRLKIDSDGSARTENTEAHRIARETKQKKLKEALEDKQDKFDKAKTCMNQKLLSNLESHKQILEELDKAHREKTKSTVNTYREKIKQKEKDFAEAKKKFYQERKKQQKHKYDERVSESDNQYQFTIDRIEREYQDAIQVSDVELGDKIKPAMRKLEAASEADKQVHSSKIKTMHEEWSKNDAKEKHIESETEHHKRSDNTKAHKTDEYRESDEQTLTQFYKIFEEKIKSDEDIEIKSDFQEKKREKEKCYEQNNKEIKDTYDKIVSDAETTYKLAEKLIEKEYHDAIQASNDELDDTLTTAQQKLDAALEFNEKKYQAKLDNTWFWWKTSTHEEWSKKDAEDRNLKIDSEESARTENIKAHKIAQETKQRKLKEAFGDKQDKIDKAKTQMSQNLLSNKESHKQALEELEKAHTEKAILSSEYTYKEKIKRKEKDFQEAKKKFYEERKKEQKHNYDKRVSEAEKEYQFTTERIEREYQDALQASDTELCNKVKLATQKLKTALEANKQIYTAKVKTAKLKAEAEIHEEWSKKDAEEKRTKSETENCARSKNISAHKKAQDTRDDKSKEAFKNKQDSIVKAETEKNQRNEDASKEEEGLNNKAEEKERNENAIAETNKDKEISNLKEQKELDELKSKEKKETNDELSKTIKKQEDIENESKKGDLKQWYEEQIQQIDKDYKNEEKTINDEYQKQLKIINDNIYNLKEQRAKCESDIQHSEEQRKKAIENILMLTQQIEDGEDLSKGQEASIKCLHEAKSALNNIQKIMREASCFWRFVHDHCKDMAENGLPSQLNLMKTSDTISRQRLWKGNTFKEAALEYQGQWYALKDVCAKASKDISLVKEEINQYICENPTKEEAIKLVQKLAADLLGSDRMKEILDKPANT